MLSRRATPAASKVLDWLAERTLPPDDSPAHLRTGRRGGERLSFISESRAIPWWRGISGRRGEIELIGWE